MAINDSLFNNLNLSDNYSDPFFKRVQPIKPPSLMENVGDFIANTVFNVIDSAAFGIPSMLLENSNQYTGQGFFDRKKSYGDFFESLGIKPYERLSAGGKFGYGTGQALGFFIPMGEITKASKALQAATVGNIGRLIDDVSVGAIKNIKALNSAESSTKAVSSAISKTLTRRKSQIAPIYRASQEELLKFENNLAVELSANITNAFKSSGYNASPQMTEAIVSNVMKALRSNTKGAKYYDDIEGMIYKFGLDVLGNSRLARATSGYISRAIDNTVNMFFYDSISKAARKAFGSEEEYDALESLKESGKFMMIMSLADFIPGGKKASSIKDMKHLLSAATKRKTSFMDDYLSGKISEEELAKMAIFYTRLLGKTSKGVKEIGFHTMSGKKIAQHLDDMYNNARKQLGGFTGEIAKDAAQSILKSLPRGIADALLTMNYLSGDGVPIFDRLNDESQLADLLIGAFMAMRTYDNPIKTNADGTFKQATYRYNTGIGSKLDMLEYMGHDVSYIKNIVNGLSEYEKNLYNTYRSKESLPETEQINAIFKDLANRQKQKKSSGNIDELFEGSVSDKFDDKETKKKRKWLLHFYQEFYQPSVLVKNPEMLNDPSLIAVADEFFDVYSLTKEEVDFAYEKLASIQITGGGTSRTSIRDYDSFTDFLEAYYKPIIDGNKDVLLKYIREYASELGISVSDSANGKLIVDNFILSENTDRESVLHLESILNEAVELGWVIRSNTQTKTISLTEDKLDKIDEIEARLNEETQELFNGSMAYAPSENPALSMITSYAALKASNRFMRIIRNKEVESDTMDIDNELRETISVLLSLKDGKIGLGDFSIDLEGKEVDAEELKSLNTFLNSLVNLKKSTGQITSDTRNHKVSYDALKALKEKMEKQLIYSERYLDEGIVEFGGISVDELKRQLISESIQDTDLDYRDYMALSLLKDTYSISPNGKIRIPNDVNQLIALSKDSSNPKLNQELIDFYSKEVLPRIQKFTDFVEVTPENLTSGQRMNALETIAALKAIYSAESAKELILMKEQSNVYLRYIEILNKAYDAIYSDKESGIKILTENVEFINDIVRNTTLKSGQEIIEIINSSFTKGNTDTDNLLQLIDDLRKDAKQRLSISEMTSMLINSYDEKFASESYSSFLVHSRLRQKLQDLIKSEMSDATDISKDTIIDLFNKALNLGNYEKVEEIIREAIALKSQVSKISDVSIYREITENTLRNTLERFQSHNSEIAKTSVTARLKEYTEGKSLLNESNSDFSDAFKEEYLKNRESAIDKLYNVMTLVAGYSSSEAKDSIIKIIHSLEQTNVTRKVAKIDNGQLLYDDAVKGKQTRLNKFVNTKLSFLNAFSLKNSIIDENGKATTLTAKEELQTEIDVSLYLSRLKPKVSFERDGAKDRIGDFQKALQAQPVTNLNKIFVYLQNAEELGIVFDINEESFKRLKQEFRTFYEESLKELENNKNRQERFKKMFSYLNDARKDDYNSIAAMVRALYYKDFLGDSFYRVYDAEDSVQLSALQKKVMKYVHVTNNKNPIILTKESATALQHILRKSGTATDLEAANAIERIKNNGYRISFYKDEFKKGENGYHTQDAYAVVKATIQKLFPNATEAQIEQVLKETTSEMSTIQQEIETLVQSSMDGSVIVSASVAKMAIRAMGADFDGGQTAFKGVLYSPVNMMGQNKALLGKQALKYHPVLSELMDKLGIDILMPATSSKIVSETLQKKSNLSFDPSKSLQENFDENFLTSLDSDNYPIETLQLLFPERKRHASNRNSSVTHGFDLAALKAYYETIDIEYIVNKIASAASIANTAYNGYKNILLEKYNEISENYSEMSAIEKLLTWGLETNSSFIQTQILRMLQKSTQDKLISMPSNQIVNSLVFVDTRLASPIIRNHGSPRNQYIQRFGETMLSYYDKNTSLDGNENIIFSVGDNINDLQDYVISMKNPNNYFSANTKSGVPISNKETLKSLQNVIKWLKSKATTKGNLHYLLTRINKDLKKIRNGQSFNDKFYTVNNTSIASDLQRLANANIGDFAIALNNHKVPKKHFADSVVNRLKGFNPKSYGSSIYTNHYDIAVPHQADQDGDKLTVYMSMPFEVIKNSTERMTLVKGFSSKGNFQNPVMLNLFGKDNYKSFEHYRNIKKAAFAIGSTVKLLGSLSMLNNLSLKAGPNKVDFMKSITSGNDAINFNQRLFSVVQSILDYHGGVPEEFLNKTMVRNFLLFGEKMGLVDKTEYEDGTFTGIFNIDDILAELKEAGQDVNAHQIVKDYILEIFSLFEDIYASVQDQYDDGVQTPLTFEQKQYIFSRFNRFKENPNGYIYSELKRKYKNNPSKLKSLDLIIKGLDSENISQRAIISNIAEFKNNIQLLENYYPQLRILSEIVKKGDMLKSNEVSLFQKSIEFKLLDNINKTKLDNAIELGSDDDYLISEYFIKDLSEKQEYNVENANNAFMLNSFLNKRLKKFESLRDYHLFQGNDEKVEYYNDLINDITSKINQLSVVLKNYTDISTKKFYIKDKAGVISNKKDSGKKIYIYRVVNNEIEFVKSLNPGQSLKTYGNESYIVALDPFKVINPDSKLAAEGLAMELATVNFPSLLRNNEQLIGSLNSIIKEFKMNLNKITSDAMNDFSLSKAKMNDIFEARSEAEKIAFDSFAFKLKELMRRFDIGNSIDEYDFYLAVAKMLLRPKISTVEFSRIKNIEIPYYKNNTKFPMQLARSITSNSDVSIGLQMALKDVFELYQANLNNANGYVTDTTEFSAQRDYEMMKQMDDRYSFRRTFIQRRFPGLDYDLYKAYRESDMSSGYVMGNSKIYYEYYKERHQDLVSCSI